MAWDTLSSRARSMAEFLGEELASPLSTPVEAAGEGSSDGSSRMAITTQLEGLKLKVVEAYLHRKRDRRDTARPVWAWLQQDKIMTAWLLALHTCRSTHSPH